MIKEVLPLHSKAPDGTYTQKGLMHRWKCCLRTVQREIRRWGLESADFIGIQPIFTAEAVLKMEAKRKSARDEQIGLKKPGRIISVNEAKRRARKVGAK